MKITAPCLYGKRDLCLETFDLPEMQEGEILATMVTKSLCPSSWKKANLDENHKRVPDDVATNPVIIGHEFCGDILAAGKKRQYKLQPGQHYVIQANPQLPNRPDCPGYSFPWAGGGAMHVVIPNEVMEQDCLPTYDDETYFEGSLVELLSCMISVFDVNYHLQEGSYNHTMGIRPQGRTLILDDTGPMGLLATDYALHKTVNLSPFVIIDTDNDELSYVRKHYPSEPRTLIHYLNTADAAFDMLVVLSGGHGFDDIFVFVSNEGLVTFASSPLAIDGCLNFFVGPQDKYFSAPINFYDVHYVLTHYTSTSGGNTGNMCAAIKSIEEKKVQAAKMITHILGLNTAGEATFELPAVGGGKKLVHTGKYLPPTSFMQIQDQALTVILVRHQGIWSGEAEQYPLAHTEATSHDQSRYLALYAAGWLSRQLRDLMCG